MTYASLRYVRLHIIKCKIITKTSLLTTAGSRPAARPGTRVVCRWLKGMKSVFSSGVNVPYDGRKNRRRDEALVVLTSSEKDKSRKLNFQENAVHKLSRLFHLTAISA